ncbi:alpha/beta hydrolase family protein [Nonomuraea roseoviolacea]|uniref:Alpha-beta hydrolase superfamily lysophospholipase n=1 Tax=Nonomuraea roseoviolacea subsp. carminata TaxID=160689 RepID=A0ABT1K1S0_9ACTN|nr:alpha/beta fold hydrolase [Nonomuraea roseoviolacea]MCP2347436.1 alpha-beta hydrolase superfamily lysophospholipase [Nonomuraea roseoviolacea subsp. carminata]
MSTPEGRPADTPPSVADFAAANLSRATGAGLDLHEYQRVTGELAAAQTERGEIVGLDSWGAAFMRAARGHLARAERATTAISAGEHFRTAARWFHFATLGPNPESALAATEADTAMGRALDLLEPGARRIEGPDFTGWLRGPADAPATVVVVPGLDSGKEEFHDVIDALLRRGMAVFAMDGPGQGALAATTTVRADYHQVIGQVADALGTARVGLVGLSLGGYYVAESAAREPRVAAAVTVSGPFRLHWDALPQPVRDLLSRRAGGQEAARRFAGQVDLSTLAPRITCPLLVVDGGEDVIPGVTDGEPLARLARHGQYVRIPHGDHLLGNARPDWLAAAADWMSAALTEPAPPR